MNYEKIREVCNELSTVDIKGKNYVQVNQRILAFRKLFPEGSIVTDLLQFGDGVCVVKATILDDGKVVSTGLAFEKETSSFINRTSFLENCETSAVGRALGMLGIGIDDSIASAEEVETAVINQASEKDTKRLKAEILGLANGDEQRVNTYVGKLFPGKTLDDLTAPQLAALKIDLARKLAPPSQDPYKPLQVVKLK